MHVNFFSTYLSQLHLTLDIVQSVNYVSTCYLMIFIYGWEICCVKYNFYKLVYQSLLICYIVAACVEDFWQIWLPGFRQGLAVQQEMQGGFLTILA